MHAVCVAPTFIKAACFARMLLFSRSPGPTLANPAPTCLALPTRRRRAMLGGFGGGYGSSDEDADGYGGYGGFSRGDIDELLCQASPCFQ